jgi:hypothetical protein
MERSPHGLIRFFWIKNSVFQVLEIGTVNALDHGQDPPSLRSDSSTLNYKLVLPSNILIYLKNSTAIYRMVLSNYTESIQHLDVKI